MNDQILVVIGNENRQEIIDFSKKNSLHFFCIEDFDFLDYQVEEFDWLINLWSPFIFTDEHLLRTRLSLNIHPSLLPIGRGRDPIVHGLLKMERLGFTFHAITRGVDEGAIIFQKEIEYEFPFDASVIYKKIVDEATSSFRLHWPVIRLGNLPLQNQDENLGQTHTRSMTESLRHRKWNEMSKDQRDLLLWISAFDFKNGYGPIIDIDGKKYKLTIGYSRMEEIGD
jgi:methionyl-tRNA formyltransferase